MSDKKRSKTPWALIFASLFLGSIGAAAIGFCAYGFYTGSLIPYWRDLRDTQVSLLASIGTIYAAAFAATIAPLIFRGQLNSLQAASDEAIGQMRQQFEELLLEFRKSNEQILSLAEQSKASLSVLQNYALHTMGFVDHFTEEQLPNAKQILGGFQESVGIICQKALQDSNKWKSTKDRFKNMWPGRRRYIDQLRDCGIITEEQKEQMVQIAESRRYTRENSPDPVDLPTLNILNRTMRQLQESFTQSGNGGQQVMH